MKFSIVIILFLVSLGCSKANVTYTGSASVMPGGAEVQVENLFTCANGNARKSPLGLKLLDEKYYTVPANITYQEQFFASDLYNECTGVTPSSLSTVDISNVPVIEVDQDGEVITGYIFADNYFELYVNGKLIAIDPIPFTPFNSNIVRFKVSKPYEIAIKAVDWEENSGLGSEDNRGKRFHPGDGGFIASFSDGTVTSANWYAQTFYTAPIYDLGCVSESDSLRISSECSTEGSDESTGAVSLHWDIPNNWETSSEYVNWPKATVFSEEEIGVDNKMAYMNFQNVFSGAGASFIWSSNVVLDNLVLLRHRVE